MQRYFFDIHNVVETPDQQGVELPTLDDAKREALRRVSRYGSDPENLREDNAFVVTVRDESRAVVATLRLVHQIEPVYPAHQPDHP